MGAVEPLARGRHLVFHNPPVGMVGTQLFLRGEWSAKAVSLPDASDLPSPRARRGMNRTLRRCLARPLPW